jgi:Fe-S-cluster containining protein
VVTHRYIDPLTQVWLGTARLIGLRVVRTPDAYASTDGRGTLALGDDAALDADDSLAQMIFHELCHSLVEGEESFTREDWGMDNTGPDHDWREHACLRVQYVLTGRHGLRTLFAPTTDFRAFWDQLSGDVLEDRTERSVQAAIMALRRAELPPWGPHLGAALAATARIAQEAAKLATEPDVLWHRLTAPPAKHPTGLPARISSDGAAAVVGVTGIGATTEAGAKTAADAITTADASCGSCAWRYEQRGVAKCRHTSTKLDDRWPACERYEAALDCQTCGACCRAAYHSVEVQKRDPVLKKQPSFIVDRGTYLEIRRDGDRCAALAGGDAIDGKATRFHCVIYDDRPRTCRDFTLGSEHCLTARRRVGLTL